MVVIVIIILIIMVNWQYYCIIINTIINNNGFLDNKPIAKQWHVWHGWFNKANIKLLLLMKTWIIMKNGLIMIL